LTIIILNLSDISHKVARILHKDNPVCNANQLFGKVK